MYSTACDPSTGRMADSEVRDGIDGSEENLQGFVLLIRRQLFAQRALDVLLRLEGEPDPNATGESRIGKAAFDNGVNVALLFSHFGVLGHVGFGRELSKIERSVFFVVMNGSSVKDPARRTSSK